MQLNINTIINTINTTISETINGLTTSESIIFALDTMRGVVELQQKIAEMGYISEVRPTKMTLWAYSGYVLVVSGW